MATPSQIFYESLKTEATRKAYRLWLEQFFEYAHEDYDSIIKLDPNRIKQIIKDYVIHKKESTRRIGSPSPNSYNAIMTPIQTFLEMNEILLNWKRLRRYYPDTVPLSNQLPYQTKHIQLMFDTVNCPRDRAFVHLLASNFHPTTSSN